MYVPAWSRGRPRGRSQVARTRPRQRSTSASGNRARTRGVGQQLEQFGAGELAQRQFEQRQHGVEHAGTRPQGEVDHRVRDLVHFLEGRAEVGLVGRLFRGSAMTRRRRGTGAGRRAACASWSSSRIEPPDLVGDHLGLAADAGTGQHREAVIGHQRLRPAGRPAPDYLALKLPGPRCPRRAGRILPRPRLPATRRASGRTRFPVGPTRVMSGTGLLSTSATASPRNAAPGHRHVHMNLRRASEMLEDLARPVHM